jgi:hypothetical protein
MPRVFDNIEESLLPALQENLELSDHADNRLCLIHEEDGGSHEPKIICSMGLVGKNK